MNMQINSFFGLWVLKVRLTVVIKRPKGPCDFSVTQCDKIHDPVH